MAIEKWFQRETWRLAPPIWTLVVGTFTAYFTLFTTYWLSLASFGIVVGVIIVFMRRGGFAGAVDYKAPWFICGLILAAYLFASLAWSEDRVATLLSVLTFCYLLVGIAMLSGALPSVPDAWLEHVTRTIGMACIVGLLLLFIEVTTDSALRKALYWPIRAARWEEGRFYFDTDFVVSLRSYRLKWFMPLVVFLMWPLLLIIRAQSGAHGGRLVAIQAAVIAVAAATIWQAQHRTSMVALLAAVVVYLVATRMAQVVRIGLGFAWIAAFATIVFVASALYSRGLDREQAFAGTIDARIIIWGYTAEQVALRPWLGVGAGATKMLDRTREARGEFETRAGAAYAQRTGPHAHNIYLQSWYELGAIGTLLLSLLGLTVLASTAAASVEAQPYMLATFATVAVSGGASFGLFELWFLGTIAFAIVSAMLAATYCMRLRQSQTGSEVQPPTISAGSYRCDREHSIAELPASEPIARGRVD